MNFENKKISNLDNLCNTDKILLFTILPIPFFLATSIFLADFFASIAAITLIFIFFKKKSQLIFLSIKIEIILLCIFYAIILNSLIFSDFTDKSLLPSIFYFRHIFLSLAIFYLLKKHAFIINYFFYSILITLIIVFIDSYIQLFFDTNFFGYPMDNSSNLKILTGFFDDEKKLGSYTFRAVSLLFIVSYLKIKNINSNLYFLFLIFGLVIIFFSSERVALFSFLILILSYYLMIRKKILSLFIFFITLISLLYLNENFKKKIIDATFYEQIGLNLNFKEKSISKETNKEKKILRYFSKEHEDLVFTGFNIFKNNIFTGSGVKTFSDACLLMEINKPIKVKNIRENSYVCSTHPHNIYIQLLSDIGIFGFLLVLYLLLYILFTNLKNIFSKKDNYYVAYNFASIALLLNIMPFIPSGSIFNNWISLILHFTLGFWLYTKSNLKNDQKY
jgi:O-antigen ligase